MKRRAQDRIRGELRGKTPEQELAYWQEQSRLLREQQTAQPRRSGQARTRKRT